MEDGFSVVTNKRAKNKQKRGQSDSKPKRAWSSTQTNYRSQKSDPKANSTRKARIPNQEEQVILERPIREYIENPGFIDELKNKQKLETLLSQLPDHAVEARIKIKKIHDSLVSIWDIVDAINNHEMKYLTLLNDAEHEIPEKLHCDEKYYSGPQTCEYLEPGLINVFEEREAFRLEPLSAEERKIPFLFLGKYKAFRPKREQEPVYAVPSKAEFLKRFDIFTGYQFYSWTDWSNMVVVGGAVCNCLMPIPQSYEDNIEEFYHNVAYKTSDIDIYCYGLTQDQLVHKIFKFYQYLSDRRNQRVLVFNTPHTVTLVTAYPQRHIQFVIGEWSSIENILFEPDVDCSCVAFDGQNVWATQRSKFSLTHRTIIASPTRYNVRGFPEYEIRLVKYSKRGFVIWDRKLDWGNVSEHYVKMGYTRLGEHLTCKGRATVTGLRLLIVLHEYKEELKNTDIMTVLTGDPLPGGKFMDMGIPYGVRWPTSKIIDAFNKGRFTVTCNYGVRAATEWGVDNLIMREHITKPRDMYSKGLVEHSQGEVYRMQSNWISQWYSRVFQSEFIEEVLLAKRKFRDLQEVPSCYSYSLIDWTYSNYSYRNGNCDERRTYKDRMLQPPKQEY